MKLSVFVVTYNQEKYIRQCLDSILMQKVDFEYEVVIGEDHGTDGTRAICEEYAAKYSQIRLLPLTENLGIVKNWKRVLSECKGEYVAMCEGDDYWTDDLKLQQQVDFLDGNLNYSACGHASNIIKEGIVINRIPSVNVGDTLSFKEMIKSRKIHTASICFRKELISDFYHLSQGIIASGDRLLFAILGDKGNVGYIDKVMAVYRKHPEAVSGKDNISILENDVYLYKKLRKFYGCKYYRDITKEVFYRRGVLVQEYRSHHRIFKGNLEVFKMLFNIRSIVDFKSWLKDYLLCVKK